MTFFFMALLISMTYQVSAMIHSSSSSVCVPGRLRWSLFRLIVIFSHMCWCRSCMLTFGYISVSASVLNFFFSWRVKVIIALGSLSFFYVKVLLSCLAKSISSQLQFQGCRDKIIWSLPRSTPFLSLTSCNDILHIPFMIRWSIWLLSPLGEHQVSLWISRCEDRLHQAPVVQRLDNAIRRINH